MQVLIYGLKMMCFLKFNGAFCGLMRIHLNGHKPKKFQKNNKKAVISTSRNCQFFLSYFSKLQIHFSSLTKRSGDQGSISILDSLSSLRFVRRDIWVSKNSTTLYFQLAYNLPCWQTIGKHHSLRQVTL